MVDDIRFGPAPVHRPTRQRRAAAGLGQVLAGDGCRRLYVATATAVLLMAGTVKGQQRLSFSPVNTNPQLGRVDFVAAVADINGDGRGDIVAGGREEYRIEGVPDDRLTKALLHILVGKEDGSFAHVPELVEGAIEARDARVVVADFNSDSRDDLAVFGTGVYVQRGKRRLRQSAADSG